MPYAFNESLDGPIGGLRLPQRAWNVLRREKITTLDQLRAAADRMERFEDIGPRMAHIIREELARLAPPNEDQLPPPRRDPKK